MVVEITGNPSFLSKIHQRGENKLTNMILHTDPDMREMIEYDTILHHIASFYLVSNTLTKL